MRQGLTKEQVREVVARHLYQAALLHPSLAADAIADSIADEIGLLLSCYEFLPDEGLKEVSLFIESRG